MSLAHESVSDDADESSTVTRRLSMRRYVVPGNALSMSSKWSCVTMKSFMSLNSWTSWMTSSALVIEFASMPANGSSSTIARAPRVSAIWTTSARRSFLRCPPLRPGISSMPSILPPTSLSVGTSIAARSANSFCFAGAGSGSMLTNVLTLSWGRNIGYCGTMTTPSSRSSESFWTSHVFPDPVGPLTMKHCCSRSAAVSCSSKVAIV
mmetsp:Transcript_27327/g.109438  ORF Transcript_27327/g.109438 Transcript_27327/m.109438 type:complete len:208 (+) Transcript_27327:1208-1831(+)